MALFLRLGQVEMKSQTPQGDRGRGGRANVGAFHMVVKQTLQTVFFSGIQQTENKKGKVNAVLISVSGTLLAALIPRKRRGN